MTHYPLDVHPTVRGLLLAFILVAALMCVGCAEAREINNPFIGPNGALDGPFGAAPAQAPDSPNS
ncbi:MAG: hypothetical protein H0V44_10450 [Planctomycetes bacterium]|nr:hypothetical protein [Planctomycetota bacterium]